MRIVSQNGFYDLPYENVAISFNVNNENQVIAWSASDFCRDDLYVTMGNYSAKEKAEKAMEMLRDEYGRHLYGTGGPMATENFYVPPFAFIPPKVFQFPKDEDVEV